MLLLKGRCLDIRSSVSGKREKEVQLLVDIVELEHKGKRQVPVVALLAPSQEELEVDVTLANNVLLELNRYLEQMRNRGPKMLKVKSLGDHPIIKFGFNILERSIHADIANSSNLVAVRNKLMRTIDEKEELLKHYIAM
ncbi:hypothetical protein Tco_0252834 [Tanacetum coccineum]